MWELDCEEGWAPKNWCFWTVVLEKALESPLDCKEMQPVHSEGDQPWDFFGRNDAQAETPVLWPPHAKSWLIGKDSDARRDWGQEEKGMTEDEMAGWHHWLDGRGSEWTLGVGDGQGDLACCDSWGRKESDAIERLNRTELNIITNTYPLYLVPLASASWPPRWFHWVLLSEGLVSVCKHYLIQYHMASFFLWLLHNSCLVKFHFWSVPDSFSIYQFRHSRWLFYR